MGSLFFSNALEHFAKISVQRKILLSSTYRYFALYDAA